MAKTWQSSRMLFAFARVTGEVMLFDILLEIDYFSVYSHKTAAFVCAMIKNNLGHLYFSVENMLRIFQSWTFVFSSVPNELSYWLACRRDSFLLTINPEKFLYNLDWYLVSQNFAWKLRLGGSRLGWMLLLQFSLFRLWISSRRVKGGDKGTEGKETSFDHTCNDATWFRNIQWKTIRIEIHFFFLSIVEFSLEIHFIERWCCWCRFER